MAHLVLEQTKGKFPNFDQNRGLTPLKNPLW